MELTNSQKEASSKITEWFYNNLKPFFVLSGYAGTGKTFLLNYIVDELGLNEEEVAFITPIGKAACVLTQKGRSHATTIHRLIYDPQKITEEKIINGKKVLEERIEFIKKQELSKSLKLIILDEISMVKTDIFNDLLSFKIPMETRIRDEFRGIIGRNYI